VRRRAFNRRGENFLAGFRRRIMVQPAPQRAILETLQPHVDVDRIGLSRDNRGSFTHQVGSAPKICTATGRSSSKPRS
jgi:hypothetical protein